MTVVLVTGMSGTGKSSALAELAHRGHRVVDTDYGDWIEQGSERLWREDRIDQLLNEHEHGVLFVSGCVANQGKFYPRFDAVVLLSAPADVILELVAGRSTNDFGKTDSEREQILSDLAAVEPLLRRGPRRRSTRVLLWPRSWTLSSASPRRQLRNKTLTSPPPTVWVRAPSLDRGWERSAVAGRSQSSSRASTTARRSWRRSPPPRTRRSRPK